MKTLQIFAVALVALLSVPALAEPYAWTHGPVVRTIHNIAAPSGFHRIALADGSFAAWLRELPLLPDGSLVTRWNGYPKDFQAGHVAVVDLDVGKQNLQQCADTILRLRAEYLWSNGRASEVNALPGNPVKWQGGGWPTFRRYLNGVFAVTGTATMDAAMAKPAPGHRLIPGDVLVKGGYPGHAVIVLDAAEDGAGNRVLLIGQGYMPAQQLEVQIGHGPQTPWFDERLVHGDGLRSGSWGFVATERNVRTFEPERRVGATR